MSIPRAFEEAAKIDGAGFFTTLARVVLPLATPAIAADAILQSQGAWNARLLAEGDPPATVRLHPAAGLAQSHDRRDTQRPPLMAVVVEGIAAAGVQG